MHRISDLPFGLLEGIGECRRRPGYPSLHVSRFFLSYKTKVVCSLNNNNCSAW